MTWYIYSVIKYSFEPCHLTWLTCKSRIEKCKNQSSPTVQSMFCTMPIIYNKSPASFFLNNKRQIENLNMYMYKSKSEKICFHTDHLIVMNKFFLVANN